MRTFAGLAMIMLVAACATGQARSTAVDPVGAFDFTTTVDGSPVTGTITITRSGAEYGGSVSTNVTESMPITAVTVEGQTVQVTGSTPDGPATLSMTFTGDTFTGTWSYAGMEGSLTGRRRAG
jgi:hypothetical protein